MAVFSFIHPQYLFFLFLIPVVFFIHFYSIKNKKKLALKFANFEAIGRIQGIDFFSKNVVILVLNCIIILLMVFAVSGLTVQVIKKASSFSFVLAIDTSESMEANDYVPNRFVAAKEIASDFVDKSPVGTRIGIVSFSGKAYIEQDVTDDRVSIKNSIKNIKINGYGGTDLYGAVITSANMLYGEESKSIVLLSDGQINIGKIEDIISYSQKNDIIINAIAVGTLEGGETPYSISKLDEDSLKSIAYNSGGKYFLAENNEALSKAILSIFDLTKKKVSINLTNYLLLIIIMLFALEIFLLNTRYINLI